MSVQRLTKVLELSQARLGARLVMIVLANHDGEAGCFVSVERIAQEAHMSLRQVQRCLRELEDLGELSIAYRKGPRGTNLYTFLLPEPLPLEAPVDPSPGDMSGDKAGPEMSPEPKEPTALATTSGSPGTLRTASAPRPRRRFTYDDPDFEAFWHVYPKRVGKAAAFKRWQEARAAGVGAAVIITGAARYRDDPNREERFTKDPEGWLHDGRWLDDPLPPRFDQRASGPRDNAARIVAGAIGR